MTKLFAMTFPILPGKTQEWEKFTAELNNGKSHDFVESRKKLGVHERTFLQKTQHGDMVIVTLEGENPETAFQNFAKGDDEFTKWFIRNVKEVHGVDLGNPPKGPLPKLIIDSKSLVTHL